jgi:hypothetical protein
LAHRIKVRKASETKVQLLIAQNPYAKDPQKLWDQIEETERSGQVNPKPRVEPKFDVAGFEILKAKMSENPHFIVKS